MKKIMGFVFLATAFMVQHVHAMFLYNYFFSKADDKYSSFIVKDNQEELSSMKVENFSDATFETKKDLYSFLSDGKEMIKGFGSDFNDLDESERKNYFSTRLIKYGHVNDKIVGIILCSYKKLKDTNEEHLFEIFSCSPLYRIDLRKNVLKEYEDRNDLIIDISKAISEIIEVSRVKRRIEFLRLSVTFSK